MKQSIIKAVDDPVVSGQKWKMPHYQSFLGILKRQGAHGVVGLFHHLAPVSAFSAVSWLTNQITKEIRGGGGKIEK